jgi:hypothetical protein
MVLHDIRLSYSSSRGDSIEVKITHKYGDKSCNQSDYSFALKSTESIDLPGKREWRYIAFMDPISGFRVCTKDLQSEWRSTLAFFHMGYSAGRIEVECKNASPTDTLAIPLRFTCQTPFAESRIGDPQ